MAPRIVSRWGEVACCSMTMAWEPVSRDMG